MMNFSFLAGDPVLQPDGQLHPILRRWFEISVGNPLMTAESLVKLVTMCCQSAAQQATTASETDLTTARIDELERVSAVTLDAATDVWSLDSNGKLILLDGRIAELEKQLSPVP